MHLQGDRAQKCAKVGNGLGHLDTQHTQYQGKEKHQGNKEDTLPGNGHHGENNTYRTGGGVALEHTHKEGVSHVVEGGNQHTDDAGNGQPADDTGYGRLGHGYEFLFLYIHKNRPET